jgi:hypothetical protein
VPGFARERLGVETQNCVARERQVGVPLERALRTVVDATAQPRAEASGLLGPAKDHARGSDDERAALHRTERLERLAQAHVVGEQRAQAGLAQKLQPRHAAALVAAQLGREIGRERRLGQPCEVVDQRAQPLEAGRSRLAELVAQAREVGQCAGGQAPVARARGEQVCHAPAVLLEPVCRERGEAASAERHE